jgi:cytosine/adenosine deaminase-related metal-dependent hydrolase
MDPALGDVADGEVHVRDGEIVAVGRRLGVRAPRIDGSDTVVMPGLVDTHWHLWTSLYRSMSSSSPETSYFTLNVRNGVRCTPDDLFHGTRLGLVDALTTGITTVHDWRTTCARRATPTATCGLTRRSVSAAGSPTARRRATRAPA